MVTTSLHTLPLAIMSCMNDIYIFQANGNWNYIFLWILQTLASQVSMDLISSDPCVLLFWFNLNMLFMCRITKGVMYQTKPIYLPYYIQKKVVAGLQSVIFLTMNLFT